MSTYDLYDCLFHAFAARALSGTLARQTHDSDSLSLLQLCCTMTATVYDYMVTSYCMPDRTVVGFKCARCVMSFSRICRLAHGDDFLRISFSPLFAITPHACGLIGDQIIICFSVNIDIYVLLIADKNVILNVDFMDYPESHRRNGFTNQFPLTNGASECE